MGRKILWLGRFFQGWYFVITGGNTPISRDRMKHCAPCDKRKGFVCGVCGCPLIAKTRVRLEECEHPEGQKW